MTTITINGEAHTIQEWADKYGVTYGWIYNLYRKGELEQRINDGSLGRQKSTDLVGMRFGDLEVIGVAPEKRRNYRTYIVRNVKNGKEAHVESVRLTSGIYTGKCALATVPAKDIPETSLGRLFKTHFREEFSSWAEFEEWASERGYAKGKYLKKYDEALGHSRDNSYFDIRAHLIEINSKALTMNEWAEELGITRQRIAQMRKDGTFEAYVLTGRTGKARKRKKPKNSIGELVDKVIGERSIKEFAEISGISATRLYRLRLGIARISASEIKAIANNSELTEKEVIEAL